MIQHTDPQVNSLITQLMEQRDKAMMQLASAAQEIRTLQKTLAAKPAKAKK